MDKRVASAVIAILTLAGVALLLTVPEKATEKPAEGGKLSGIGIASKIYGYIEGQRRDDGYYDYASNCNEDDCKFDFKNPHEISNAWAAYAAIGLYRATGQERYLDDAKRDGEKLIQFCGSNEEECVSITYQIVALYEATGDPRYLELAKAEAGYLMDAEKSLYDSGFTMLIGGDSKGLADLGTSAKDPSYSDSALRILDGEEKAAESDFPLYAVSNGSDSVVYKMFSCWPQLARISLYRSTGDGKYLKAVEEFADSFEVAEHVGDLYSATDMQPCADMYQNLAELTGEKRYDDGAKKILQRIITDLWDSEYGKKPLGKNSVKFMADKGFSTLTDSSYMVYLLSRDREVEFGVV